VVPPGVPGAALQAQGAEFLSDGIGGSPGLPKLNDLPADPEFDLVGHEPPGLNGIAVRSHPAAIVFGVGRAD